MGKSFFEVFPALKLDDNIKEIMEQTLYYAIEAEDFGDD